MMRGTAAQLGAHGRSGPKAARHKQGPGGLPCTSCAGGPGCSLRTPPQVWRHSLSRSVAGDTTLITVMRVHSYDCFVNSGLER